MTPDKATQMKFWILWKSGYKNQATVTTEKPKEFNDSLIHVIKMSEHQRVLEENKRLRKALENIDHCMTLNIARKISSEALSSGGE